MRLCGDAEIDRAAVNGRQNNGDCLLDDTFRSLIFFGIDILAGAGFQKFVFVITAAAPDRTASENRGIHVIIILHSLAHQVSVPRRPGRLFGTVRRELGGR